MPFRVVSRAQWGARRPQAVLPLAAKKANRVFLMNSHFKSCEDPFLCPATLRLLQTTQIDTYSQIDIRFNFIVGGDGRVYEGRGWSNQPLLPVKFEKYAKLSLLIGLIGEYTVENLPDCMDSAVISLIKHAVDRGSLSPAYLFFDILTTGSSNGDGNKYCLDNYT